MSLSSTALTTATINLNHYKTINNKNIKTPSNEVTFPHANLNRFIVPHKNPFWNQSTNNVSLDPSKSDINILIRPTDTVQAIYNDISIALDRRYTQFENLYYKNNALFQGFINLSHKYSMIIDQATGNEWMPLNPKDFTINTFITYNLILENLSVKNPWTGKPTSFKFSVNICNFSEGDKEITNPNLLPNVDYSTPYYTSMDKFHYIYDPNNHFKPISLKGVLPYCLNKNVLHYSKFYDIFFLNDTFTYNFNYHYSTSSDPGGDMDTWTENQVNNGPSSTHPKLYLNNSIMNTLIGNSNDYDFWCGRNPNGDNYPSWDGDKGASFGFANQLHISSEKHYGSNSYRYANAPFLNCYFSNDFSTLNFNGGIDVWSNCRDWPDHGNINARINYKINNLTFTYKDIPDVNSIFKKPEPNNEAKNFNSAAAILNKIKPTSINYFLAIGTNINDITVQKQLMSELNLKTNVLTNVFTKEQLLELINSKKIYFSLANGSNTLSKGINKVDLTITYYGHVATISNVIVVNGN